MARAKKHTARHWYSINFMGGLVVGLYLFVPAYFVYADSLGLISPTSRAMTVAGLLFTMTCVIAARRQNVKLFSHHTRHEARSGFTLVELLIVLAIIGILSAIILPSVNAARTAAFEARSKSELKQIATALELYTNASGGNYPPDADRNLPPGLEAYLAGGDWPAAPWPGSVYDWDAWQPADLSYNPKEPVHQISIRFCPLGEPTQCKFPDEEWAEGFDYYSSAYYCLNGPCRAHSARPLDHPGYCFNC